MAESLVSVIIPCYRQARFLDEAIESALNQTRRPDEIVVIDNDSQDGTTAAACGYPQVRYVRQEIKAWPLPASHACRPPSAGHSPSSENVCYCAT